MRINHNLSSMSTQTSMFKVNRETAKSLQKLSTGLRINSSADDAAGLGVSENLRTQVRGSQQALRNTQDAISMLQIADGALNEQASILQRMREVVIQAKNETYTQTERDYMYQEVAGLIGELDRIAAVTNYNGMALFCAPEAQGGGEGQTMVGSSSPANSTPHILQNGRNAWDDPNDSIFGANDYASAHHFNMMIGANYTAEDIASFNNVYTSYQPGASNMLMIQFGQMDSNALLTKDPSIFMGNASAIFDNFNFNIADPEDPLLSFTMTGNPISTGGDFKLDYLLKLIDGSDIDDPLGFIKSNNTSGGGPTNNMTGLQRVSQMRGNIGATINRLEHASNNLLNQITNMQSAESMVRDVDFATEATTLSRNQILSQSSTAMLAQSNMLPQGVLRLLQ